MFLHAAMQQHVNACQCIKTQQTRMKQEKLLPEAQVAVWMEECGAVGAAAGVLLQSACTQQHHHHHHLHHEALLGLYRAVPLAVLKWTAPRLGLAFVFWGGMKRTAENRVCLTNRVRHQPRR